VGIILFELVDTTTYVIVTVVVFLILFAMWRASREGNRF